MIVGDAIVWWRAWIIWKHQQGVKVLCIVLILATLSMIDLIDICQKNKAHFYKSQAQLLQCMVATLSMQQLIFIQDSLM